MKSIFKFLQRFGLDGFILFLLSMILLAWLWPQGGIGKGPFSVSTIANYGVSLIFFFYGLRLSMEKLKAGLSNWKLHVVIQLSTFILFPIIILCLKGFMTSSDSLQLLWLSTFFLASLPSTVSSSVVMVSIANGNMAGAIFNSSISSIMGIFLTPLWMSFVSTPHQGDMDLSSMFTKLMLQVLLPVTLGLLLHKVWGALAEKYKKQIKYFDQTIILMIVYTSFCESFEKKIFSSISLIEIIGLSISMLLLFFFVFYTISLVCKLLKFNREDKITAVFCGSKKSLVHGTVMSKVLFGNSNVIGILLLPLMIYHAMQLIIASIMAKKFSQQVTAKES